VRRAAYLGLADAVLGEKAVAAVALEAGIDAAQVAVEAERLCAKNSLPLDALYVLDDLPMDPRHHSKVEYDVLRGKLLEGGVPDSLGSGRTV
jgi:olefin beta-lactone synthetase